MPQGESFWNPYRWVTISDQPIVHDVPGYHHRLDGRSGRIRCELKALTPLLLGDGSGGFVRHAHNDRAYIPATSLKGTMRSLAEIVGNACVPFRKAVDRAHDVNQAHIGPDEAPELDIVARTFGYLNGSKVFSGLVHFSDAEIVEPPLPQSSWPRYSVAVGRPRPSHQAFYPGKNQRKFYHHQPGTEQLTPPPPGVTQTVCVQPAPSDTYFTFTVNFENLRDIELNLLLYCLTLEEHVTVTFGQEALDPNAQGSMTLQGPLRHKIGGAKPHGAGSVRIRATKMWMHMDARGRYRGGGSAEAWEKEALRGEIARRTDTIRRRTDRPCNNSVPC